MLAREGGTAPVRGQIRCQSSFSWSAGDTVKQDRAADAAALRAAGEKLDALLKVSQDEVDEMVEEFKQLRKGKK